MSKTREIVRQAMDEAEARHNQAKAWTPIFVLKDELKARAYSTAPWTTADGKRAYVVRYVTEGGVWLPDDYLGYDAVSRLGHPYINVRRRPMEKREPLDLSDIYM